VAWKDFASHPVRGVGTHNYEATSYRLRERTAGFPRQPHMLPLEVLAERGVVGVVLFLGFLAVGAAGGL
jgi:O-antigen ligase